MRFDAKYFIDRCHDAGFTITRMGNRVHYTTNGKPIAGAALFVDAVRKHKRQLIKHLPERTGPKQLDLFEQD
ncbi:hypothetical protein A1507_19215 [Methylomonas koyamae]|uniref:Uncharacterized protein n=1 Tax=Methylomonas koyamae TaxID=702114 RepID=A0A177N4J2_9GAMM|nr:hypothetical protein [Methylomonas koyamae]OAI12060.1 hypothetical protein A1507_19215 [Methylomonas koyamae]